MIMSSPSLYWSFWTNCFPSGLFFINYRAYLAKEIAASCEYRLLMVVCSIFAGLSAMFSSMVARLLYFGNVIALIFMLFLTFSPFLQIVPVLAIWPISTLLLSRVLAMSIASTWPLFSTAMASSISFSASSQSPIFR